MPKLLPDPIEINGELVRILVNNSKTGTSWYPLLTALIERLYNSQIQSIVYNIPRRGYKIINYDDVVNCFDYVGVGLDTDYADAVNQCICGVTILNQYKIYNKLEPNVQYRLGCECIKHWSNEVSVKINNEKKRKKDPHATFCLNCGFKNNKKSCRCDKKELNNLTCKIFKEWKMITKVSRYYLGKNEKVGLGYFKEMTCYTLITSKTPQVMRFKKWLMNDPKITGLALTKRKQLQKYEEYIFENAFK